MEDKQLYSYKEALEQPNWVRSLAKIITFDTAVKFSRFVYCSLVAVVLFLFFRLFRFIPLNYNVVFTLFASWMISGILEDLKVDGRPFIFYFKDYLLFYLVYGVRHDRIIINKGKVYSRLDKIVEEENT